MRVTAGKYKNKQILTQIKGISKQEYRPIKSKVREAIFNILQKYELGSSVFPIDAVVADVFCGCGTFGIESLSRGAKHVFFINNSSEQMKIVRENIKNIGEDNNADYLITNAAKLSSCQKYKGCNLIYLDPPYNSGLATASLEALQKNGWIAQDNIIIVELAKKEDLSFSNDFELLDQRLYGNTKLMFLRH